MNTYEQFLASKADHGCDKGFEPSWVPGFLFDFQRALVEWSVRKGRAAIFADCGLGKTAIQLVWAENVVRHTNRPVLILTPLSVAAQTVREAEKFGVEAVRSGDGKFGTAARVVVTNYERLHHFDRDRFAGVVCDESSILKNFDGVTKEAVTEFMRVVPYRLLCTATAAPNDYIELGTSSEALGELGYMDMLKTFFKSDDGSFAHGGGASGRTRYAKNPFGGKFRFRGHAERDFWRWVCSWARAVRKPSDLGFADGKFVLPDLVTEQHVVTEAEPPPGALFNVGAVTLAEQRAERKRTLQARCELAAGLVARPVGGPGEPAVCWCHLNPEGDLLERLIDDAEQVSGSDPDERKEELFTAFAAGQVRVLVTKPTIAAFGLNWQHCAHQTFFPSHSFEQYYQAVRRCWRFGQERPVKVDVVTSEGEDRVLENLNRKARSADEMFGRLVELMNAELNIKQANPFTTNQEVPSWL